MTNPKTRFSKRAFCDPAKFFHLSAALILTGLALIIIVATAAAHAQTYTDLYNFGPNAFSPLGILAQGRDGNLYGTTPAGLGPGVVFKITPSGVLTALYNLNDGSDGKNPTSGLTLGTDGNFYGTTTSGGASSGGTVFKITPTGAFTTLYAFTPGADGSCPEAPPIQGTDGNFYGTTSTSCSAVGTVYKFTPSGIFTTLTSNLSECSAPGCTPPLLQGIDGNLYSTTSYGGGSNSNCFSSCGTVFKITPKGTLTAVHNFAGTDGRYPAAPLVQDRNGNLYGTTVGGGTNDAGVVFKLTPQGTFTVLHNFGDPNYPNDGTYPYGGLVQASDGNFYGATTDGGTAAFGVIFQITPAGAYSILFSFDGTHGYAAASTPVQHTNGKIYGLAEGGGTHRDGVFYSFDLGLPPFVSFLLPAGKAGKTVEILGQGFTGATAVSFNGVPAAFKIFSSTYLIATAPSGVTTGPVTVTTPTGTLTSNKPFRVLPTFLNFNPTNGPVGTPVVLTGSGLTQTTHVSFGGVTATFTVDSDTQVTATVPAGAQTSTIQITTLGGFASTSAVFTVTQ